MSFASQEGSSIGQNVSFPIIGNDNNTVNNLVSVVALDIVPPKGTFIFTTSISVYSLPFAAHYTLGAKLEVVYEGKMLAKMRLNDQENNTLCVTGILFSDGIKRLKVLVGAFNDSSETTQLWGYSPGSVQLVRLNNI